MDKGEPRLTEFKQRVEREWAGDDASAPWQQYYLQMKAQLDLPASFRGSPEELLASMMEIAAPFRNAAATLSEEDRSAAERDVYDNLRPLYDGTLTRVTAPILIVTAVSP